MKKVLITMAVLTSMVAGAMVFSSFVAPKTNDETVCSHFKDKTEYTYVGEFTGVTRDDQKKKFYIWETKGQCGSYSWSTSYTVGSFNRINGPDGTVGVLRQNTAGEWYAGYDGKLYYINF